METHQLIQGLVEGAKPVSRLLPPWRRMALWLAMSGLYAAVVVAMHLPGGGLPRPIDFRLLLEQAAILATAATAGLAAFSSVVPGRDQRILLLPLVPLAVWLATLGQGCIHDWRDQGVAGLQLRSDWDCALPAIILSIPPAIAMVLMLRRGAPLIPRVSLALGALAIAAIANIGLRIFHIGDLSIQIMVWHLGGAAVLSIAASRLGTQVLNWRASIARSLAAD
jgi:hypothetical protein